VVGDSHFHRNVLKIIIKGLKMSCESLLSQIASNTQNMNVQTKAQSEALLTSMKTSQASLVLQENIAKHQTLIIAQNEDMIKLLSAIAVQLGVNVTAKATGGS
jgi:hypothetical protein